MYINDDDISLFIKWLEKINKVMKKVTNTRVSYSKVYFIDNGYIYMREKEQFPQYVEIELDESVLTTAKGKMSSAGKELERFKEIISNLKFNISSNKLSSYISERKKSSVEEIEIDNEQLIINNFYNMSDDNLEFPEEIIKNDEEFLFSTNIDMNDILKYEKSKIPFKCYIGENKLYIDEKPENEEYLYLRYYYNAFIFPANKKTTEGRVDVFCTDKADNIYDVKIVLNDNKGMLVSSMVRVLDIEI